MDLFRAVLRSGEKTPRVLQLTEDLLEMNPANYTIWFVLFSRSSIFIHPSLAVAGNTGERFSLI